MDAATTALIEKGVLGITLAISLGFNFIMWRYIVKLVEQLRTALVNSTLAMQDLSHVIRERK